MTGITCAVAGSGGGYVSATAVVTVGYSGSPFNFYGYDSLGTGSISPSTWDTHNIDTLYYSVDGENIFFVIQGIATNSGWATMTIAGTSFNRINASYSTNGSSTNWVWSGITTNPFGTTVGATKTVVWG